MYVRIHIYTHTHTFIEHDIEKIVTKTSCKFCPTPSAQNMSNYSKMSNSTLLQSPDHLRAFLLKVWETYQKTKTNRFSINTLNILEV